MPEISLLGWFHTSIAIIALVAGFYSLVRFKFILLKHKTGRVYLICTFIAAATALVIFRHGGFGAAHALAILTLLALAVGTIAAKTRLFSVFSPYIQAMSYSATLLFHLVPAITDGLMRLPVESPIVTNIEDPLLKEFYLVFLITYMIGVSGQFLLLRKRGSTTS